MRSIFEHAGGHDALRRVRRRLLHQHVRLADPLLIPLFGTGKPEHVDQLTAFDSESFGGPDQFTRTMGGFAHLIDVHRAWESPKSSVSASSSCTWLLRTRPACRTIRGFVGHCAPTSNSGRTSPYRTRMPLAMPSCTRCARYRAGRGPTTRKDRAPMPDIVSGAEYTRRSSTPSAATRRTRKSWSVSTSTSSIRLLQVPPGSSRRPCTAASTAPAWSTTCSGNPPNTSPPCNAHPNSRRSPAASRVDRVRPTPVRDRPRGGSLTMAISVKCRAKLPA